MENSDYYKYFSGDDFNCGSNEQCNTQNNEFCDTEGLNGQDSTWKCFQRNDACVCENDGETLQNGVCTCPANQAVQDGTCKGRYRLFLIKNFFLIL